MLESALHQAQGLIQLGLGAAHTRLIGVCSHGSRQGELPLLWGLCSHWVAQGERVLVLEGHVPESPTQPGLLGCLRAGAMEGDADTLDPAWQVWAAAQGLASLTPGPAAVATLFAHLSGFDVVLIYAPVASLVRTLAHTGLAPLLVLANPAVAPLPTYEAAKQLIAQAGLRATVANIAPPCALQRASSPAQVIQNCSQRFLGTDLPVVTLHLRDSRNGHDLDRLATRLLEQALSPDWAAGARVH